DGCVVSDGDPFDTVTVTPADVFRFPAASRAIAVRVCEPFPTLAVFQEVEYGAAVSSAPSAPPSRRNCTPATPTLSEAVALTVTVDDTVAPFAGDVMLTDGGVVSGGGTFDTVTVTVLDEYRRPSASRATALSVCGPFPTDVVLQDTEYGDAPSSAPRLPPSSLNWTPRTRRPRGLTLALTPIVLETVA